MYESSTFLSETLQRKLVKEDKDFRGQKKKDSKTSDSIAPALFKKMMLRTKNKRDDYRAKNDMHNYIKTNACLCVHIHTYFCGCRAQREIIGRKFNRGKETENRTPTNLRPDLKKTCLNKKLNT